MDYKYKVPIIPQNLSKNETIVQIAEVLDHLSNVTKDIFNVVNKRLDENNKRLSSVSDRLNVVNAKINKLKGAKKATQVFSSSKYPASDVIKDYVSIFADAKPIELQRHKVRHSNFVSSYEPLDKLQFYHVKTSDQHKRKQKLEGLGNIPPNVEFVNDLLLFNSGKNLYKNFVMADPLSVPQHIKAEENIDTSTIGAAPVSISERSTLEKSMANEYFYNPKIGEVPELDVPLDLPDLPGIADDLRYENELDCDIIAPSERTSKEEARTVRQGASVNMSSVASADSKEIWQTLSGEGSTSGTSRSTDTQVEPHNSNSFARSAGARAGESQSGRGLQLRSANDVGEVQIAEYDRYGSLQQHDTSRNEGTGETARTQKASNRGKEEEIRGRAEEERARGEAERGRGEERGGAETRGRRESRGGGRDEESGREGRGGRNESSRTEEGRVGGREKRSGTEQREGASQEGKVNRSPEENQEVCSIRDDRPFDFLPEIDNTTADYSTEVPNIIPPNHNMPGQSSGVALPKQLPVPPVDVRANLMEAIRQAGGAKNLKPAKVVDKDKALPKAPAGDLMADLHNKLLMRRKGISGKRKTEEPHSLNIADSTFTRISAMIPEPKNETESSSSSSEDWN